MVMPGDYIRAAYYGDSRANGIDGNPSTYDQDAPVPSAPTGHIAVRSVGSKCLVENINPTVHIVANCGVSGDTLDGMIARETAAPSALRKSLDDAASKGAQILFFRAGINSITAGVTGAYSQATADSIWAKRKDLLQRASARGMFVIDEGEGPWEHTNTTTFPAERANAIRQTCAFINTQARAYAAASSGQIVFLDVPALLGNADLTWASYAYCSDCAGSLTPPANTQLVHPSNTAGLLVAIAENTLVKQYFGNPHPAYVRAMTGITSNLIPNADLTGVITAGVGAGWSTVASGTGAVGTSEVIDRNGILYQSVKGTFSGPGSNNITINIPIPVIGAGAASPLVSGGKYSLEFKWFFDDGSGGNPTPVAIDGSNLLMRLRLYTSASDSLYWTQFSSLSNDFSFSEALSGHVVFPVIVPPFASASIIAAQLFFQVSRTDGATQRIGIGAPRLVRLS